MTLVVPCLAQQVHEASESDVRIASFLLGKCPRNKTSEVCDQQKFTCITTKCLKMLVHIREFSKLILQFFVICLSVRFSSEF